MNTNKSRLLPDIVYHPLMLLFLCGLPQLGLLLLQAYNYNLVKGELTPEQRGAHVAVFAVLGACVLLWFLGTAVLSGLRKNVPFAGSFVIFGAGFGYLWLVLRLMAKLIPENVGDWMLAEDELAYQHMILTAPALFYGLVTMAGIPLRVSPLKDVLGSVGIVIAVPVFWMLIVQGVMAIQWDVSFPVWVTVFFVFLTTAILLLAFLRLMLMLHRLVGQRVWLPVVAALVCPLAGLLLNATIPFPTNLQYWQVYALTVLNAVAVCIPLTRSKYTPLIWSGRVATYPFTLYFFILFLPFLPLSIPAMLAVGSGFLILAPTLLFVIHSRRLISEGRIIMSWLGLSRTALLAVVALSIMPAVYLTRAHLHKQALSQAVDATYHPDYSQPAMNLKPRRVKTALIRLHEMKDGLYLPMLSEVYNDIVFDGMILPDHKMEEMETILFGEPLYTNQASRGFQMFGFIRSSRLQRQNWNNVRPPSRHVQLQDVSVHTEDLTTLKQTELVLTMKNQGDTQAEYLAAITLPRTVVVSDFWLDVEGTRVPGRIFDRETALWVFHMIRDRTRRDPGIVHYVSEDTLELRVFPFSDHQTRTCGIKLLYPESVSPEIKIDSETISLNGNNSSATVLAGANGSTGLLLPQSNSVPTVQRKPYFHFLVDISEQAVDFIPTVQQHIADILDAHPGIEEFRIDFVNYESQPVSSKNLHRESWRPIFNAAIENVRPAGGFWPERAIAVASHDHGSTEGKLQQVPVFVFVSPADLGSLNKDMLPPIAPDIMVTDHKNIPVDLNPPAIHLLRCGNNIEAVAAQVENLVVFNEAENSISAYDGESWQPVQADQTLLPESAYSKAVVLRALEKVASQRPADADSLRAEILEHSRGSGILSKNTAYIVVENSAQWEMLKRKEEQSMESDSAHSFDEFKETHVTPEPETWMMIITGLIILSGRCLLRTRKRR